MEDLAPEAFFCSDGHTFDRDSIEAWYAQDTAMQCSRVQSVPCRGRSTGVETGEA